MAYYLIDENNNKVEVTDEVLNTLVEQIKCCVSGTPFKMAFITQAKFNELEAAGKLETNTYYEIMDDTTADDNEEKFSNIDVQLKSLETRVNELGFKEGVFEIEVDGINSPNLPTVNKLVKQGQHVIGTLLMGDSGGKKVKITIPQGFKPAEECDIAVGTLASGLGLTIYNTFKISFEKPYIELDSVDLLIINNAGWRL